MRNLIAHAAILAELKDMLSRFISLTLTLIMIAVSFNVIRQSMTLAKLRDQVAEMEDRLGSASPPDETRMWIKLLDADPQSPAWRVYTPPLKEFRLVSITPGFNGQANVSGMRVRSSNNFQQHSTIRFSFSKSDGVRSSYMSCLGSTSQRNSSGDSEFANILGQEMPDDALETTVFAADGEQILDLDTPVPLLVYRVKEEFIQAKLNDGTIDEHRAKMLRGHRGWYFGTVKAIGKLENSLNQNSSDVGNSQ